MAEQRTRFVGTHEHGLDDKGRMVLPAKIRAQLGETGMIAMADGCPRAIDSQPQVSPAESTEGIISTAVAALF